MKQKTILTRRDFLRLALLAGGAAALSPLLKACGGSAETTMIQFLGNACILITAPDGTRIVCDPYGVMRPTGLNTLPRDLEAEAVTVSHDHFDHNNVDAVGGEPQVITAAGTYQVGMIKVTGYQSREGSPTGPSDDVPNVIFVFEIAGARIVHLGDAGLVSEADALAGIADADVILVNIDGYVSPLDDILPFMQQINAHTIIPVHFSIYPYARWGTDQTLTLDEYLETLPDDVDIVRKDDGELRVTPDMPDQIAALSPTRLLDL